METTMNESANCNQNPLQHVVYDRRHEQWNLCFGLSPVSAENLLRKELPHIPHWMCWNMGPDPAERALRAFLGEGINRQGTIGPWKWERIPCAYGNVGFWSGSLKQTQLGTGWTGLLRITTPESGEFYLFGYLRVDLKINAEYMVSTGDLKLLRRFADDVHKHIRPRRSRNSVHVNVVNSMHDFTLRADQMEKVYLPDNLYSDILAQVDGFFGSRKVYKDMGIPFKRGFLFTGLPGTGKTMLIRNLIRHCHRKHRVGTSYLSINRRTDADDLRNLFQSASGRRPALLILEDVESLCQETMLTRSEVLAELDGINQRSGMLLIATANDPGRIDPALVHRPSRFDRVWTFPLPDQPLRARYFAEQFTGIEPSLAAQLAEETSDWTFAYIKELRNTAGILAIREGLTGIEGPHIKAAFKLLREQFEAGKKGHAGNGKRTGRVGFGPKPGDEMDEILESVA